MRDSRGRQSIYELIWLYGRYSDDITRTYHYEDMVPYVIMECEAIVLQRRSFDDRLSGIVLQIEPA